MKILIISANSFSKKYNNGKTLEAMFSKFEQDSLAQLFTHPMDSIDFEFCSYYYSVSELDIIKRILINKKCGGRVEETSNSGNTENIFSFFSRFSNRIPNIVRDLIWSTKLWNNEDLNNWIDKVSPKAVFLVAGQSPYLYNIADVIIKRKNIPLFIYYTDDYLIYPSKNSIFSRYIYKRKFKLYSKYITKARKCFCIGELMAKEYGKLFKKEFIPFMNSVVIDRTLNQISHNNQTHILSYFGGLHLNRWNMLKKLATCLPSGYKINVYTSARISIDMRDDCSNYPINIMGFVAGEDLQKEISASEALIHVESDDLHNRLLTHLSISTKIPEYLISGKLIIAYGPEEVASMQLLEKNKLALVINSSLDSMKIKELLSQKLNDNNYIDETTKSAFAYAQNNFDVNKNARLFKELITNNL